MESEDEIIARAPLPTEKTLKARKSVVIQLWRFIAINFRMVRMIFKGNH